MRYYMRNQKPPFEITKQTTDCAAKIVGKLSAISFLSDNPTILRSNQIRTIPSSLTIEQNTLSVEQATTALNGKHVLAPP